MSCGASEHSDSWLPFVACPDLSVVRLYLGPFNLSIHVVGEKTRLAVFFSFGSQTGSVDLVLIPSVCDRTIFFLAVLAASLVTLFFCSAFFQCSLDCPYGC